MAALCGEAGVPLRVIKYFEGERATLKQHFEAIEEFEAGGQGRPAAGWANPAVPSGSGTRG